MKALTLWQPYASALGRVKWNETRSWPAPRQYWRQDIAIHAGAREPSLDDVCDADAAGIGELPLGAVVSVARLTDCVQVASHTSDGWPLDRNGEPITTDADDLDWGDFSRGRWIWRFANVRVLAQPVPYRGAQGLWNFDEALLPQELRPTKGGPA